MKCPPGPQAQTLINSNPDYGTYLHMMSHNKFPISNRNRLDNSFKSLFRSKPALVGSPHEILLKNTCKEFIKVCF